MAVVTAFILTVPAVGVASAKSLRGVCNSTVDGVAGNAAPGANGLAHRVCNAP